MPHEDCLPEISRRESLRRWRIHTMNRCPGRAHQMWPDQAGQVPTIGTSEAFGDDQRGEGTTGQIRDSMADPAERQLVELSLT